MTPIKQETKLETKGGLAESAIFAIITAVGAGMSVISSIASGVLNTKANNKKKEVKMMNVNYARHSSTTVY